MLAATSKPKKNAQSPAALAPAAQLPLLRAEPSTLNPQPSTLNSLESSVIDLFVQLSRVLGQPRSFAEIYGLLFISARPLAMDSSLCASRRRPTTAYCPRLTRM